MSKRTENGRTGILPRELFVAMHQHARAMPIALNERSLKDPERPVLL
jgi:hypothetical protein